VHISMLANADVPELSAEHTARLAAVFHAKQQRFESV
jgi:CTP:molybdopterin cytidylyltransferase MocA